MLKNSALRKCFIIVLLFNLAIFAIFVDIALARAGGGGGGHAGGGGGFSGGRSHGIYSGGGYYGGGGYGDDEEDSTIVLVLVVLGMMGFVYLVQSGTIQSTLANQKSRRCDYLIREHLALKDPQWEPDLIQSTVEKIFLAVQQAWTKRDYSNAQKYMSEKLYHEHQRKINRMLRDHQRNVLEDIRLDSARIISLVSFGEQNLFWVQVEGYMVDYTIDEEEEYIIEGELDVGNSFTELWKFVLTPNGWILDEICQDSPDLRYKLAKGILVDGDAA